MIQDTASNRENSPWNAMADEVLGGARLTLEQGLQILQAPDDQLLDILAAAFRCLTFEAMRKSVIGALRVTLMAYLIVFGSATFSQLLAFSGASRGLVNWAISFDLAPLAMLLVMFAVLLLLGMFMEQISIMLLTVPIFFPLAHTLGFDPIWFGLIMLLSLEISFTTPPFGLLLFVMKGVAPRGTTMREIYTSAFPFIFCSLLLVALLIGFPQLALWLPSL